MGKTAQTFGKISRRSFLGLAGATGVGVALTGCAPAAKQEEPAADSPPLAAIRSITTPSAGLHAM